MKQWFVDSVLPADISPLASLAHLNITRRHLILARLTFKLLQVCSIFPLIGGLGFLNVYKSIMVFVRSDHNRQTPPPSPREQKHSERGFQKIKVVVAVMIYASEHEQCHNYIKDRSNKHHISFYQAYPYQRHARYRLAEECHRYKSSQKPCSWHNQTKSTLSTCTSSRGARSAALE